MKMTMKVVFDAETTAIPELRKAVEAVDDKAEITFHATRESVKPQPRKAKGEA